MAAQEGYAAASGGAATGASLYVVGLDANVTYSQLYRIFSEIGEVASVEVCEDTCTGISKLRYGYVHYKNPQCAQRALEELNSTPLNGKPIRIIRIKQEASTSKSDLDIAYIKNLENEIDHKILPGNCSSFEITESCSPDASGQSMGNGSDKEFTQKGMKENSDNAKFVNLFVKNLCLSTTEEDLEDKFGEFGSIRNAVVMKNEDGTSKGFGFVNFENAGDAERAVESLNGQIFGNKKWFVARAQKKIERQQELKHDLECVKYAFDNGSNLFVKNLDRSIDDEKLKEIFTPFGSVTSCKVLRDEKGNSIKRGLVAFSSPEEASHALPAMNGKLLVGKPLCIAIAQRKEDRRAPLQNSGKKSDHPETISSSEGILAGKVAKDTSGHSNGFVQFSGQVTGKEAIEELARIFGKFSAVMTKFNGIIGELNSIVRELNGLLLNGKQVDKDHYHTIEIELLVDKANPTMVFARNFCESTTEEDLKNIFGEFGLVTDTVVMRNEDGVSKCFGFVNFKNAEDAAKAVDTLNGQIFDIKKLYSWRAQKKLEKELELKTSLQHCVKEAGDEHSNNLCVKNLNDSISDENFKELFSSFGLVTSCKVLKDREGRSIGSGFIAFSSPQEASRALSEMNGRILFGKPLHVSLAQRKQDSKARLQNLDKEIDHKAAPEKVDKASNQHAKNHSIAIGMLSEVFSPSRSFPGKMMPDQNGIRKHRGFATLSPSEQLSQNNGIFFSKLLNVAQAQGKEDRRAWLQGQPRFGYEASPLMQSKQQSLHSCGSRHTNSGPLQKYIGPSPATKQQMLPGRQHCPPRAMFSVQYERGHNLPLCDGVKSRSIPVGALASLLANASSVNRGRCLMTRILSSCHLNM